MVQRGMALLDYALARKRDPDLMAGSFVGETASAAFGVHPDEVSLRAAFDEYLDGTRQGRHHLMLRYFDEDVLSLIAVARRE